MIFLIWFVCALLSYLYMRWDWTKRGFHWTNYHAVSSSIVLILLGPAGTLISLAHYVGSKYTSKDPRLYADDKSWWNKKARW